MFTCLLTPDKKELEHKFLFVLANLLKELFFKRKSVKKKFNLFYIN